MKFLAVATFIASVTADHTGHNHSLLKPLGPFYGILTHMNKAGTKQWNDMELGITFKESTFDIKWFYGAKTAMVNIEKQTFECSDVPFTFDEVKLRVVLNPEENECLKKVNSLFPKGWGLPNPFYVRVDHDSGDLKFGIAKNMVVINLWAVDALPANIPSGEDGLAPASTPGRRQETSDADAESTPVNQNSPAQNDFQISNVAPPVAASDADKSATARVGSVIVSTAAIILAGLFL